MISSGILWTFFESYHWLYRSSRFRTGQQELVILKKLAGADPENRRHCVRLLSSFEYRHHLCLVFESLHMNLREILKKFGRNIGINLTAVRAYAKQLFIALKHLKNCGVLHCDIKPDNMLVSLTVLSCFPYFHEYQQSITDDIMHAYSAHMYLMLIVE